MTDSRVLRFGLAFTAISTLAACGAESHDTSDKMASIVGGSSFTDTVGYVFVSAGGCSGTLLSPQWVLTAGHCFRDVPGSFNPPSTSTDVYVGTNTGMGQTSSDIYIHPNWWNPNVTPPNQPTSTFWNSGYDVALVRLPTPFSPSPPLTAPGQYPGFFYNQLSNRFIGVGDSLLCSGYGYTVVPGNLGGVGILRDALLPVIGIQAPPTGVGPSSSVPMVYVGPNSSGQIIYNGDSGGSCYTQSPLSDPYVISGINSIAVFGNGRTSAPTAGYLVYPWYVEDWVDSVMHSAPIAVSTAGVPSNPVYTSGASTQQFGPQTSYADFIIAANPAGPLSMEVTSGAGPGLGFFPVSTAGLPTGSGVSSGVGIGVAHGSNPQLYLSRIGVDGQMYVARLVPGGNIRTPWGFFSNWSPAGKPAGLQFVANTPAVVFFGSSRVDYFARATDNQIWTRWITNGVWQSDWTQIPSSTTFQSGPSVALAFGNQYYVTALSTDGSPWINGLGNVTNGSYGGPWWSDGVSLGGYFSSNVAITGWQRGLDFYGIGGDNNLYHESIDNDWAGSGWMYLGGPSYSEALPNGVSAMSLQDNIHKVDVVITDLSGLPKVIRYPR